MSHRLASEIIWYRNIDYVLLWYLLHCIYAVCVCVCVFARMGTHAHHLCTCTLSHADLLTQATSVITSATHKLTFPLRTGTHTFHISVCLRLGFWLADTAPPCCSTRAYRIISHHIITLFFCYSFVSPPIAFQRSSFCSISYHTISYHIIPYHIISYHTRVCTHACMYSCVGMYWNATLSLLMLSNHITVYRSLSYHFVQ